MHRLGLFLCTVAMACGAAAPRHNGYKSDKARPWNKAKVLTLNGAGQATAEGELDYASYQRAKWFALSLPTSGALEIAVDASPLGANERVEVLWEVLDPSNAIVAASPKAVDVGGDADGDETGADGMQTLPPGRYLLHVYVPGRLDAAAFELTAKFKAVGGVALSGQLDHIQIPDSLPRVPVDDDTPGGRRRDPKPPRRVTKTKREAEPVAPPPPSATTTAMRGMILRATVRGRETDIVFSRAPGVESGMRGNIDGLGSHGQFVVGACTERACKSSVTATPEQLQGKRVVVTP